jgi:hypothetical protein
MAPITANGKLHKAPTNLYSVGKRADEASEMAATSKKLTHQGDRNKTANKERSDIFHFIGATPAIKGVALWMQAANIGAKWPRQPHQSRAFGGSGIGF